MYIAAICIGACNTLPVIQLRVTCNLGNSFQIVRPESGWDLGEISAVGALFSFRTRARARVPGVCVARQEKREWQESAWLGKKKEKSLWQKTCLADKTNLPVERLSLNRSQCGSCSTKYDTSAGT